ncbi:hypothetical protein [Comamonas antarctica]|uniref:crAss001_48 related protein n=1 Tax=Comamonas antarctica TaxID=2743470 RepID=UPI0028EDBD9D|nr:hypothetical protein [Comamonas antarctica]
MNAKLYEGTKRLTAQPMTRGEYNAYRGWVVPANEDPADAGYLVEDQNGGTPNDPRHVGYISWSPIDVFERTYKVVPGSDLPPHQQRVLGEKMELDLRISALDSFIDRNPIFEHVPSPEQARLKRQLDVMHELSVVLGERIANF